MKKCFGYIRVSTAKQGERGVSLQEQRDAIVRFTERNQIEIAEWFEERETAAKRGRPVFSRMLAKLKAGLVQGVIIHKIDRSARNLKDWADLGELIDRGVEVRFTNDSLDLTTRGGRLSADIQAVVAADYIRNLREETKKGFYGRLKQGLYPLPAPIGYLDRGKGNPKEPDPVMVPLVRLAFELYVTGRYTLDTLNDVMQRKGLRNRKGNPVTRNGLSTLLNNPFYYGMIRLKRTRETFLGVHKPIVSKTLFDSVQDVLTGKTAVRLRKHDLLYRRMLTCGTCGRSLIGGTYKRHVYYRCQTTSCPTTCLREEAVETAILDALARLRFTDGEAQAFQRRIDAFEARWNGHRQQQQAALELQIANLGERRARLVDAYVDKLLDQQTFTARHQALLQEQKDAEETRDRFARSPQEMLRQVRKVLELAGTAWNLYKTLPPVGKRDLVKTVFSNRVVYGKNVDVALRNPFGELEKRPENTDGSPLQDSSRTYDEVFAALVNSPIQLPESLSELDAA